MKIPKLTPLQVLDYEVRSSRWACLCSGKLLQALASRYFSWKVRRKWRRYELNRKVEHAD